MDQQIVFLHHKTDSAKIHVSVDGPKDKENWHQDSDVLDTWASSWIWPMGVHDWPKDSKDLSKFYPTNTLVTGPDIIFFWVARMMMMGNHLIKKEPFSKVYVHALVRDEKGQKMSKSKGNVIDPLNIINKYNYKY